MDPGFDQLLEEGSALPFSGWDFSPIRDRWNAGRPPWDYVAIVRRSISSSSAMLDLGTGGGELLESLAPLPSTVFATEGYPPNLDLARERLTPLGVRVLSSGPDLRIPLDDRAVDLVLDRHEEFSGPEVYRVLTPEGWFVTQQVGGRNLLELRQRFGSAETRPTNDVTGASALAAEIARSGLVVHDAQEAVYAGSFRDVGALVYFLRAAPWEVPGFSVTEMRGTLREIHEEIRRSGSFRVTTHRLLVLAQRPA